MHLSHTYVRILYPHCSTATQRDTHMTGICLCPPKKTALYMCPNTTHAALRRLLYVSRRGLVSAMTCCNSGHTTHAMLRILLYVSRCSILQCTRIDSAVHKHVCGGALVRIWRYKSTYLASPDFVEGFGGPILAWHAAPKVSVFVLFVPVKQGN